MIVSEFNKLYEHLKECVDSDDHLGITEQGIEFNMFEWAFGLAVKAKTEHAQLQAEKAELIRVLELSASWHEVVPDYQESPLQVKITNLINKFK